MIHLRCSVGFWICFDFRIYQSWEYIRVLKQARVTQGFEWDVLWQYSEYALDSEYARVLNMLGLHKILNKIVHHRYFIGLWVCFELWICQCYIGLYRKQQQESKYDISYKRFWIKCFIVHIWQGSEYTMISKYVRILNILGYMAPDIFARISC